MFIFGKTISLKPLLYFSLLSFLLFSCSKDIYSISKKSYKKEARALGKSLSEIKPNSVDIKVSESQNFNLRKPQFIMIHHTAQDSCERTYALFSKKESGVSSHYVICKDGTVIQMLNDYLRGWHSGRGKWHSITDMNSLSLGIELDNNGVESFSDSQIESLTELLHQLVESYQIPPENIIGHADWAPGRKVDPNQYFPWKKLAEQGLGIWYDEEKLNLVKLPEEFDAILALKILGYDTSVPEEAFYSFKLHFDGYDGSFELTELDKKKLYLLTFE